MSEQRNRRLISGERVVCRCSLELPKLDPFSNHQARHAGFMVLNVRGGSLYLTQAFTDPGARRAFPDDPRSVIRKLTLYPRDGEPVLIGDIRVRYLKLIDRGEAVGLVLRFVNTTEHQLDLLNGLPSIFPAVTDDEASSIPLGELRRA